MSSAQPVQNRMDQILLWLQEEGRLDVADLAVRLGVAQETVRRDLRSLELEQKLQRVHGGAVPTSAPTLSAPGLPSSDSEVVFARRVWNRLPRTGTILLGAGRLSAGLAQAVVADPPEAEGLTIVTNHLDAAIVLSRAPKLSVYNLGGTVNRTSHAQEGDWALSELTRLHIDVAVLNPAGVSVSGGVSQPSPAAAAITRAEVDAARLVVVLADRTTLGATAFVQACGIERVDQLAVAGLDDSGTTGPRIDPRLLQDFADRGVSMAWTTSPVTPGA